MTTQVLGFTALRTAFMLALVLMLARVVELGTPTTLLLLSAALGVWCGSRLALTRLSTRGLIIATVCGVLVIEGLFELTALLLPATSEHTFLPFLIREHLELSLAILLAGLYSTWAFWRWRHAVTIEVLMLCAVCVLALSAHRGYRLDSPQVINSLAWYLGLSPQATLVACGAVALCVLLVYISVAGTASARPTELAPQQAATARRRLLGQGLVGALIVLLVVLAGTLVTRSYRVEQGLLTNGVGEGHAEGSTPLGFHSALGTTNQPAALVRLENDYSQNPYSPMLYMREGALSQFNGKEIAVAGSTFDTDVSNTGPSEPFVGTEDKELRGRIPVTQSIYILSDQKAAFAIDYPIQIKPLKNPDPQKFRAAYRAYSLAPTYSFDALQHEMVGDPRWSEQVRKHYLEEHPDLRYKNLALELTQAYEYPIQKAFAILQYLTEKTTYTLRPNHQVEPGGDPVAPYLFGDLRGYCVHFAHATVYMLRSLGIPSRIGTGFLTDLSQSKDGHILLRMSDRHAWAEIYVAEKGWVPFDITPQNVESAADHPVDMKLLEELMQSLEPGEELLPKDTIANEENVFEKPEIYIPQLRDLAALLGLGLALLVLFKLYLRFGWLLAVGPARRLRGSYVAVASLLTDLGVPRSEGETRLEFERRAKEGAHVMFEPLVAALNRIKYGDSGDAAQLLLSASATTKQLSWWKRVLAFFNPASIVRWFSGRGW